ncbi:MAG: hypothetical protein R3282_00300 [Rhodothermales bacterium]|nr:hypothetical protein [Rhodothermales bacterium]
MVTTLAIFSVLVISMSLYGVIRPSNVLAFAGRFLVGPGIWAASAIRILLAVLLWLAAPSCQTPLVFRVLAAVVLLAAIAIPIAGSARMVKLVELLQSWPAMVVRIQGVVGLLFGAFVLWSIWPAVAS